MSDPRSAAVRPSDDELIAVDAGSDGPTSNVPSDNTTLVAILAALEDEGYLSQFGAVGEGLMRCASCGESSSAGDFSIDSIRRSEGASDPDDMLSVIAARCPRCDVPGTAVLGFVPMSSTEDADASIAIAEGDDASLSGGA
jgi:hypothetical protein